MKTVLIGLCLLTCLCQLAVAQKLNSGILKSPQELYDYYWNKRNNKNTVGWVLLGTGVASIGIGLLVQANVPGGDYGSATAVGLAGGGLALMLTSIPFFVSASINKRKARLALKKEKVSFGNQHLPNAGFAALSIGIPL